MFKLLQSYRKKKDGSTAIEFSLLAIPFIFLSVGIMELSIMYASASLLEGATSAAARLVRTGQAQRAEGQDAQSVFRDRLCGYAEVLIECDNVVFEAIPLGSFGDFDSHPPTFDEEGTMVSQGFAPGEEGDRVLIRVSYQYKMMTPFVGPLLAGADNQRLFVSTIVLQNEPYNFRGAGS